ncbi:MAG: hypothetical protein A2750_02310 [Candidatus Yanofskybacteria bacterium RIFCSPHIGHO2_01_FULL_45_42]|uniref:VWFA domain-containing protein n=2 Tax=Candidatus Yanofskyibacteriota TaxID=1752733 RepID=A0A1F8FPT5_9BACT|nr:MAG: hypothetical protein A2750_02310 [Candidatus Yanofskybacteria bacterium RIFCSPHIGHO2_01_FULL_45_42]OGN15113.1 MAG: hypothetical protein A3J47_00575 [Candidatus Yanofskybacteria bacterium RIFCSPHIGHO2_02_FULL_43_22]
MPDKLYACFELIKSTILAFRNTDFSQVSFDSLGFALGAGLFLLAIFLYKILRGCDKKFYHSYSGQEIPGEYSDPLWRRLICLSPFVALALSTFFLILALANPYLPRTVIEEIVESLEMVELIDTSSSMGWEYLDTGRSAGETARERHLEFREMRRGQNDRVTLWIFSNNAYKIQDFIIDDDVYVLQLEDAPIATVDSTHPSLPERNLTSWLNGLCGIVAPKDMIRIMQSEGGTNLRTGLRAVTQYFDFKGDRRIKRKAVLVVSDAATELNPEEELAELQKRGIATYFIHVQPNRECEMKFNNTGSRDLLAAEWLENNISRFGGRFFSVDDPASIERAYAEINRLETAPFRITRHLFRVLIYQRPLAVAVVLAATSLFSGIFIGFFFETYP